MELNVTSTEKQQLVDITSKVADVVKDSGAGEGLCNVYVPHATAAVLINENDDPNISLDLIDALSTQIPEGVWRHDKVDGNAAAHIKASIVGPSETIPIVGGKLQLGTWQNIFLCDFDGPRRRKVTVTIIKA